MKSLFLYVRSLVFVAACLSSLKAGTVQSASAGPLHTLTIDISSLSLDSTTLHGIQLQCWTGTGFSGGDVTGKLRPLSIVSVDALSMSSITINLGNDSQAFSNVACAVTGGTLSVAQLPNPTSSTLGGVESLAAISHNFLTSISTLGVPVQAQPAFTDISGTLAAAQLPNPTSSTLGGIESLASVSHTWINTISTSGVPSATQPAFSDISGTYTPTTFTDFPDKKYAPAANCNNASAGFGWSLPASNAASVACHAGTNVQDGYLTFADAQSAQFSYLLPDDWDSTASLDAKLFFTDASTSGTVIWQAATSCTTIAGAETDDQSFNTAQSFGTITLSGTASAGWVATLTGMTKTGCAAGNLLHVKISRTTDTAAGVANASGVQLTVRRSF